MSVPSGLESKVVDQEYERPPLAAEAVAQTVEPGDRALVQIHTMRCFEAALTLKQMALLVDEVERVDHRPERYA